MALFIRNSLPESGNKFYNTTGSGGYSTCVPGNSQHKANSPYAYGRIPGLNVLPNCVGFVNGAFNETVSSVKGKNKEWYALNFMAKGFITMSSRLGLKCIRVGGYGSYKDKQDNKENITTNQPYHTPPVGSIMVWTNSGAGHVAYVSAIVDANTVLTTESNYSSNPSFIANKVRKRSSDNNWGMGKYGTYIGCVINPVVTSETIIQNLTPYITSVMETVDGKIHIKGNSAGNEDTKGVRIYYKFNSNVVSIGDHDGHSGEDFANVGSNYSFDFIIDDKNAELIAVTVLQLNEKNANSQGTIFTCELKVDRTGCVKLYTTNKFNNSVPHIFTDGNWRKTIPYIYTNGEWVEILN